LIIHLLEAEAGGDLSSRTAVTLGHPVVEVVAAGSSWRARESSSFSGTKSIETRDIAVAAPSIGATMNHLSEASMTVTMDTKAGHLEEDHVAGDKGVEATARTEEIELTVRLRRQKLAAIPSSLSPPLPPLRARRTNDIAETPISLNYLLNYLFVHKCNKTTQ